MTRHFVPFAAFACFLLIFSGGASQAAKHQNSSPDEAQLLQQAYDALRVADHDYQGHRIKAMHHIEEASKALGSPIRGDGKGDEPQGESDSQLKKAQGLLQQITSERATHGNAGLHLKGALTELATALALK